jgi:hypothetical protein
VNPFTGVCACLPGYAGADCSTPLFPACRQTLEATHAPHGWPPALRCLADVGSSCECLRQCTAQHNAFPLGNAPCFERAGNETLPNLLPGLDEPVVSYWSTWNPEDKRREMVNASALRSRGRQILPLSSCPDRCSLEGVCLATENGSPDCSCFSGLSGPSCAEVEPKACMLSCSGRGDCVRGICVCKSGWFGMACTGACAQARSARCESRLKVC